MLRGGTPLTKGGTEHWIVKMIGGTVVPALRTHIVHKIKVRP